jgi:hypothetical protein
MQIQRTVKDLKASVPLGKILGRQRETHRQQQPFDLISRCTSPEETDTFIGHDGMSDTDLGRDESDRSNHTQLSSGSNTINVIQYHILTICCYFQVLHMPESILRPVTRQDSVFFVLFCDTAQNLLLLLVEFSALLGYRSPLLKSLKGKLAEIHPIPLQSDTTSFRYLSKLHLMSFLHFRHGGVHIHDMASLAKVAL